jgi:threonine dehydratase
MARDAERPRGRTLAWVVAHPILHPTRLGIEFMLDLEPILTASRHIDPVFLDSPIDTDSRLDRQLGCHVLAKVELDNPVGSFKGRGTELFCATSLMEAERLVAASAGNFGQGLARAAAKRGHPCAVFAAENANRVKIDAMRRFGADVHLAGADFDAAKAAARHHATARGLRFVEDGLEPALAEGAGTIALELLRDTTFDAIVLPLGNGALLAGIGTVLRELTPHTEIIAVVADNAPAMKLSLETGDVVETDRAETIADGIAVRVPIASTLADLRARCDDIIAVSEQGIFDAMQLAHRYLGRVTEPAGAAGLAAILGNRQRFADRRVATILSGGNISLALRDRLLMSW